MTPTDDFWQRCLRAGCVIVPVKLFTSYDEHGNVDQHTALGTGYIPLPVDNEVIYNKAEDECYFMIEEGAGSCKDVFPTPEAALKAFEEGGTMNQGLPSVH